MNMYPRATAVASFTEVVVMACVTLITRDALRAECGKKPGAYVFFNLFFIIVANGNV